MPLPFYLESAEVRCGNSTLFRPIAGNLYSDPQDFTVDDDAGEVNFWSISIPANAMVNYGDRLHVCAYGAVGNTARTRVVKLYFGTVTILTITNTAASEAWWFDVNIFKDAANGGNSIRAGGFQFNTSVGVAAVQLASNNLTLSSAQTLKTTANNTVGGGGSVWTKQYEALCDFIGRGNLTP